MWSGWIERGVLERRLELLARLRPGEVQRHERGRSVVDVADDAGALDAVERRRLDDDAVPRLGAVAAETLEQIVDAHALGGERIGEVSHRLDHPLAHAEQPAETRARCGTRVPRVLLVQVGAEVGTAA